MVKAVWDKIVKKNIYTNLLAEDGTNLLIVQIAISIANVNTSIFIVGEDVDLLIIKIYYSTDNCNIKKKKPRKKSHPVIFNS